MHITEIAPHTNLWEEGNYHAYRATKLFWDRSVVTIRATRDVSPARSKPAALRSACAYRPACTSRSRFKHESPSPRRRVHSPVHHGDRTDPIVPDVITHVVGEMQNVAAMVAAGPREQGGRPTPYLVDQASAPH